MGLLFTCKLHIYKVTQNSLNKGCRYDRKLKVLPQLDLNSDIIFDFVFLKKHASGGACISQVIKFIMSPIAIICIDPEI